MVKVTPEQKARYALDFGVARSDLPTDAQLAYDRLVEQPKRALRPLLVSPPRATRPPAAASPCRNGLPRW